MISHYRILKKLGEGGTGEVYLAEDTTLGRPVALKILLTDLVKDEDRVRRFIQEAKSASALNHPHIVTIYEIGQAKPEERGEEPESHPKDLHEEPQRAATLMPKENIIHYIAMEYVDGDTLDTKIHRDKAELEECLNYLAQVADGLSKAHAAGIIHRDLKPENIMITRDGYAKILDFGLAKLIEPKGILNRDIGTATTESIEHTEPGALLGTISYMSPEQAQGKALDQRSDIFSFGCVLYEAITGHGPFEGKSAIRILHKVVYEPALPIEKFNPDVPKELKRIVRKCLEKDRERRYQTARDLLSDLKNIKWEDDTDVMAVEKAARWPRHRVRRLIFVVVALAVLIFVGVQIFLLTNREGAIDSIAALPFVNMSGDPDTEYLSDGITESIINSLSRLPKLRVVPRNTVFRYKGQKFDYQKIARELNVRVVLTGKVVHRGEVLSIQTELVDAASESQFWGDQYTRKFTDILVVQEEIAREISQKLRLKLTGEEKKQLTKRYTENIEAYEAYLKGRNYWNKYSEEGTRKAIEYFQQAIEKDPNYALAYAGLADAYLLLWELELLPTQEAGPKAAAAAKKALEIDDKLAEAHVSLACVKWYFEWAWPAVESEYKRAIGLNANYATAHRLYGGYLALMGRLDEAMAEVKRAQQIDPLSINVSSGVAWVFYVARRYDRVIDQCQKTFEIDPNNAQAHWALGLAYELTGRYPEAISELQKASQLDRTAGILAGLGHAYAVSGMRVQAQKVLDELKDLSKRRYIPPDEIALVYIGLGEKDRAFEWLEKASQERTFFLTWLKVDPLFDSLRTDPRFANLVRRIGLPP